jgi:hypothetical protein
MTNYPLPQHLMNLSLDFILLVWCVSVRAGVNWLSPEYQWNLVIVLASRRQNVCWCEQVLEFCQHFRLLCGRVTAL